MQCDPEEYGACDSGCNGGLMTTAFEYTLKAGGLEREEDYPYTGTDRGGCKFDQSKIAASVSNFSVISTDEDQIAANLVKHGPLAGNLAFSSCYKGLIFLIFCFVLLMVFWICSGYQRRFHANIHWRSFMPIHLWKALGSWSASCGIWICRLCSYPLQGEAILDH